MHIDFDNYDEFEEFFIGLNGQYMSPGGIAQRIGVSRQVVNNWVKRDVINSYRYNGVEGQFVIIPLTEIEKAVIHMNKNGIDDDTPEKKSMLREIINRLIKK